MSGGAIGPGDWVECIDAAPLRHRDNGERLLLGALYLVRWAGPSPLTDIPSIRVVGVNTRWWASRFRPIYRPKSDFRELLTTPADQRERVDA